MKKVFKIRCKLCNKTWTTKKMTRKELELGLQYSTYCPRGSHFAAPSLKDNVEILDD